MKRKRTTKYAACLWSTLLMGGVGLPILAQEQDVQEEFQIGGSDTLTPEVNVQASSGRSIRATDAEIDEIISSNLKADIHARDAMGNWTKKSIILTKENIREFTMMNEERTVAQGSINMTCFPEGYVFYSGNIYGGAEEAQPTYDPIPGMVSTIPVSKNKDGKWSISTGYDGLDYWCAQSPSYEELKDVRIKFYSEATGNTYELPLKENTYEGRFYWDGDSYHGDWFGLNLHFDEYKEDLKELTGSEISFGWEQLGEPVKEREICLAKDKNGKWRTDDYNSYQNIGITFLENPYQNVASVAMYRLYNPNSGEHFYTKELGEKIYLVSLGWTYEGEGWKAPEISNVPVYRLYNPNAGDHHYTVSAGERDYLVRLGWNYEGIGWYSDEAQSVPLYRQYNPNAKAGSHNYTTSKGENDFLVSIGWNAEGIAWYGMK